MMLDFPVGGGGGGGAGRPTNLDKSRATANFACSRFRWGLIGHFFLSSIVSLFFIFVSLSGRWPDRD